MAQGSEDGVRTADMLNDACRLDQAKLQSSSGALYLINFLDNLETQLALADATLLERSIRDLEACLSILVTTANTPISTTIGRPVRRSMARIYALIFEKRDGKGLFDSVRSWLDLAGEAKGSLPSRLLAFHLISESLQSHGKQVNSILPDVWQMSCRIMRLAGAPIILRAAACCCGQSALSAQAPITNEALAREAFKTLKQLISEKSFFMQRAAANSLSVLFTSTAALQCLTDIDAAISLCIKALDCAPWTTRRSIVGLVVTLSILTQIDRAGSQVISLRDDEGFGHGEIQANAMTTRTAPTHNSRLSSPDDMLTRLSSHYHRNPSASVRNAIIQIYATLIHRLGYTFVEENHQLLLRHLFTELGAGIRTQTGSYQSLLLRHYVRLIVGELVAKRLTRGDMYMSRIRQVASDYLEPALRTIHNPEALTSALQYVSSLLLHIGTTGQDDYSDHLFTTLSSLSCSSVSSVRVYATQACTILLTKSPSTAAMYISKVQDSLTDDMQGMEVEAEKAEVLHRIEGRALLLASLVASASSCPLYVPIDVMNRLMSLATRILRSSGDHPLSQALVEIQAAWHIVDGLVNLGHGFTSIHLPQLLLLWKNAVPKPSVKDVATGDSRTATEWQFLLGMRQSALRSLSSCLGAPDAIDLLTSDVTRRILNMLGHGLAFLGQASTAIFENLGHKEPPATLVDAHLLYQIRLFTFASTLLEKGIALPSDIALDLASLCTSVVSGRHMCSVYLRSTIIKQPPVKASSLWELAENAPPCLNSILNDGMNVDSASPSCDSNAQEDTVEYRLEALLRKPSLPALEHDVQACVASNPAHENMEPMRTSIQAVDCAVRLLAQLYPVATDVHKLRILSELDSDASKEAPLSWQDEASRANILAACQAIVIALTRNRKRGVLINEGVLHELARRSIRELSHRDTLIREAAAAAFGALCDLADKQFMSSSIQASVTSIVTDTSPAARAGRASAFAQIYCSVGTLAAAPALKVIVEVLLSLVTDPHPTVRYWAIRALAKIALTAGLDFSPYINSTTTVMIRLYMDISSEPDGASSNMSPIHATYSTYEAVSELLTALIGSLGPGSGASSVAIAASTAMVRQFLTESDTTTVIAANKTLQSLLIVLPQTMPLPLIVKTMQDQLASAETAIKASAMTSIYQLVQRDVSAMSTLGGSSFVEGLFRLLDDDPHIYGVQLAIHSWLDQTGAQNPQAWIDITRRVMQKGAKRKADWVEATRGGNLEDEESVSLGVQSADPQRSEVTRWTTQVFALQCLTRLLSIMRDARPANASAAPPSGVHTQEDARVLARLPDLMRIAFISTNSDTLEVQLAGLELLRLIIREFSAFRDPSSPQVPLLEQFQASIVSTLASMLNRENQVELLSLALLVSGEYISSKAIQQVTGVKRLTGPLTEGLATSRDDRSLTNIVQLQGVNHQAAELIKGSMLNAWALIAQATSDSNSSHLLDLIQPHWKTLQTAWVSLLKDKALNKRYGQESPASDDAYTICGKGRHLPWLPILKAFLLGSKGPSRQSMTFLKESDVSILLGMVVEQLFDLINSWNGSAVQIHSSSEALQCLRWLAQATTAQYGTHFFDAGTEKEIIRLSWRLHYLQAPTINAHLPAVILAWQNPKDGSFSSDTAESIIRLLIRLLHTTVAVEAWQALLEITATLNDDDRYALLSITWLSFFDMFPNPATRAIEPDLLRVFSRSIVDMTSETKANNVCANLQGLSASLIRRIDFKKSAGVDPVDLASCTARLLYLIVTSSPTARMWSEALLDNLVSIFGEVASSSGYDQAASHGAEIGPLSAWKALLGAAERRTGAARWITVRSIESLTALLLSNALDRNAESYIYECLSVSLPTLGDVGVTYLLSLDLLVLLSNDGHDRTHLRNRSAKDLRIFSTLFLNDVRRMRPESPEHHTMARKLETAIGLFNENKATQQPYYHRQSPAISLRVFS